MENPSITRLRVAHYHRLLETEQDTEKRALLERMLVEYSTQLRQSQTQASPKHDERHLQMKEQLDMPPG